MKESLQKIKDEAAKMRAEAAAKAIQKESASKSSTAQNTAIAALVIGFVGVALGAISLFRQRGKS